MASIQFTKQTLALTGDGTSAGLITVASTADLHAGLIGWILDDDSDSQQIMVTEVVSATQIRLRLHDPDGAPTYKKFDDMSAFTAAQNAVISFPHQPIEIRQFSYEKKTSLP